MIEYALLIYTVVSHDRVNNHGPVTIYPTETACKEDAIAIERLAPDWMIECRSTERQATEKKK
jgi:hypothetical protein